LLTRDLIEQIMIIKNWTEKHTDTFRKDVLKVKHNLAETGLFTDINRGRKSWLHLDEPA